MALTGSCMCGEVAYQTISHPEVTALCHCIDCQKGKTLKTCYVPRVSPADGRIQWTGGAFTANAAVTEESFSVVRGSPKYCDVPGASGKNNRHFFCPNCGSSLYTRLDLMQGKIVIKAGGLDNGLASLGGKIGIEFYCKDRVAYMPAVHEAMQEVRFGEDLEEN